MQKENIKLTQDNLHIDTKQFNSEFQKRKKSIFYAYYLCLLMSGLGLHKFYLGDQLQGIRFLSLYWLGLFVFSAGFGLMNKGNTTLGTSTFIIGTGILVVFFAWSIYLHFIFKPKEKMKS